MDILRTDIINKIIEKYKFKTYLEIGVYDPDDNFNKINAEIKVSVDPKPRGDCTYKMTSNEFFANHIKTQMFDVIFIDGLHVSEQAYNDVHNAIKSLNENGCIIMHDCNPATEYHTRTYEEFLKTGGPWNGTTYKAFIFLKYELADWSCFVVNEDHGCGIITKRKILVNEKADCNYYNLSWNEFNEKRKELLQLTTYDEFINIINNEN
jgi:hypothetical protein